LKIERTQLQPYFAVSEDPSVGRRKEVVALGFPGVASRADAQETALINSRMTNSIREAFLSKKNVYVDSSLPENAFEFSAEDGKTSRLADDSSGNHQVYHSAKVFPGNSGGPLVDPSGVVIGINTLIMQDRRIVGDGKDATVIGGDTIYVAYTIAQMREELQEHIPDPLVWIKD
jgi:hypothetical protein